MFKGSIYTEIEIDEIISNINILIAEQNKGIYQDDVNPREVCKFTRDKLKDLKYFIENGSHSTNFATKNELSYPVI